MYHLGIYLRIINLQKKDFSRIHVSLVIHISKSTLFHRKLETSLRLSAVGYRLLFLKIFISYFRTGYYSKYYYNQPNNGPTHCTH